MTLSTRFADGPALVERILDPAHVVTVLRSATLDEIGDYFRLARSAGQRAWMAMAVCVGEAQSRAGRGDGVLDELAKLFGMHRSRVARLGRIYRDLLLPRIEQQGEGVVFELQEQAWYEIATEAAPILNRDPLALLTDAEERKAKDSSYSTRRWKLDLGIHESADMTRELRNLLAKLSGIEDDVIDEFVRHATPHDRLLLTRVEAMIHRAHDAAQREERAA